MSITVDTTVFKSFANFSDLQKKTAGKSKYVKLSNGYFIPVTLASIKRIAISMEKNEDKFCGQITYLQNNNVQIAISE